ncbi:hypothetical protein KKF55_02950 [Patescibacteria group bacterium]|nr:hypothetical protein [Patescibacteria group bacterium]
MLTRFRYLKALFLASVPQIAWAAADPTRSMHVGDGPSISQVIQNVGNVLITTGLTVCTAIFVIGTFFYIISLGDDQRKGLGKGMMIGAIIGAIIIASAKIIMNTTLFFVYGTL